MLITEVAYFLAYFLLILAFYSLTRKGKARWKQIREKKRPFNNLGIFLLITAVVSTLLILVINFWIESSPYLLDDWFLDVISIMPFCSLMLGLYFFFFSEIWDDNEKKRDRTQVSGKPAGERPWYFYTLFFFLVPVLPIIFVLVFGGAKFMFGVFPLILAGSSLCVDILLTISNRKHNIGLNDKWSKAALVYANVIAITYSMLHAARFVGHFYPGPVRDRFSLDLQNWSIVYMLVSFGVYLVALASISLIINKMSGYKVTEEEKRRRMTELRRSGSSHYNYGPSYFEVKPDSMDTQPRRPYRSILDAPEISDDYYGMHGEFDLNDESRRISEDIQQFHRSHPDADLSDHYYWEDILDAETDGYLDEE